MKKILLTFVLVLAGFAAFGQADHFFAHKSGKFTLKMDAMGQTMETQTIFDDYGAKQWSSTSVMGQKVTTLFTDGKSYMLTPQFQEVPAQDMVNYMDLTPEIIEQYDIKMVGIENIDGYDCMVYTLKINQQGMEGKGKTWIWDGFSIRAEVNIMGMTIVTRLTKLETDIPVDQSLFILPNK